MGGGGYFQTNSSYRIVVEVRQKLEGDDHRHTWTKKAYRAPEDLTNLPWVWSCTNFVHNTHTMRAHRAIRPPRCQINAFCKPFVPKTMSRAPRKKRGLYVWAAKQHLQPHWLRPTGRKLFFYLVTVVPGGGGVLSRVALCKIASALHREKKSTSKVPKWATTPLPGGHSSRWESWKRQGRTLLSPQKEWMGDGTKGGEMAQFQFCCNSFGPMVCIHFGKPTQFPGCSYCSQISAHRMHLISEGAAVCCAHTEFIAAIL